MKQSVWRVPGRAAGDSLQCGVIQHYATDVVQWIDIDMMIINPLVKAMDATKLMAALDENYWSIVQPHEEHHQEAC